MEPKLFDAHSHLNFPQFDRDREEVIKRMLDSGIRTIVVGTDKKTSEEAVKLAERYENIYASIGLHPTEGEDFDYEYCRKLAKNPKVVAIGECGLDYYRTKGEKELNKQKDIFKKQIELAIESDKPLIVHIREAGPPSPDSAGNVSQYCADGRTPSPSAHADVTDILSSCKCLKLRGDIHFFSGDWRQAQVYFDLGFLISFSGVVTFARCYDETIKKAPLDKIMIETDSPFAAPSPYRGKRNEPAYLKEIAAKIAEIREIACEEFVAAATQNALKLFLK